MKRILLISKFVLLACILMFAAKPSSYAMLKITQSGTGEASLATWSVTLSEPEENNYLSILPDPNGTEASYTINITSQAEVDIIYTIVVDNLPSGVSVSLDGDDFIPEENNRVIISDVAIIAYNANTKTKTHTLTFKASASASQVSNQKININVFVRQNL